MSRCGIVVGGLWLCAATIGAEHLRTPPPTPVRELDDAIYSLAQPKANVRDTIRRLLSSPGIRSSSAAAPVDEFLNRLPSDTGDFACSKTYLRRRARAELMHVRDRLLGDSSYEPEPDTCYVEPAVLDTARVSTTVDVFGYDLDRAPLQLFLVGADSYTDISDAVVVRSHHRVSINLDRRVLRSRDSTLGLAWGHLVRRWIPLVSPTSTLCHSRVDEVEVPDVVEVPLERIAGAGPLQAGSHVRTNLTLEYEGNELDANLCANVEAPGRHGAAFSGCARRFLSAVGSDRVIEALLQPDEDSVTFATNVGGRSPAGRWTIDAGLNPDTVRLTVMLHPVQLATREAGQCVPRLDYQEARRRAAISETTARVIDPQLRAAPPLLSQLRMRFAPER